jgi:hypothetical protein
VRGHPGLVFKKRYARHAVLRKRQARLDVVIDRLVDRLIKKGFVAATADGKLQINSRES